LKHPKWVIELALNGPLPKQYWNFKLQAIVSSLVELDIQVMERAMGKLTLGQRQWVLKHITGQFVHEKMVCQGR